MASGRCTRQSAAEHAVERASRDAAHCAVCGGGAQQEAIATPPLLLTATQDAARAPMPLDVHDAFVGARDLVS